jgi:putative flavoprotein involved in K+ transport
MSEYVDTIVVGGGQAGLAASYYLSQAQRPHIVFERSLHPAHAWRNQRWDSFTLVTPNWMVRMPGAEYDGNDPDGFLTRDQVVSYLSGYVSRFHLPVRYGVEVRSIGREPDGSYLIATTAGGYQSSNVIVATGLYQGPRIPAFADKLPSRIQQIHSSEYRNPTVLPEGAVLVVGAGQSGAQIAEELYESGRRVFLSVGRTVRTPRRYRGRDVHQWGQMLGMWDRTVEQLQSPREKFEVHATISGKAGGRTLNLHQFARDGVVLLGRLRDVEDGTLVLGPDLRDHLAEADQFEAGATAAVDEYIEQNEIQAPACDLHKLRDGYDAPRVLRLDLAAQGITSLIWASGYTFDFSMIQLPVRDADGYPIQTRGVTEYPGLYFLGMPWLHSRKSGLLYGVGEDAGHVVSHLLASHQLRVVELAS